MYHSVCTVVEGIGDSIISNHRLLLLFLLGMVVLLPLLLMA
jgi:hypothetical protein